MKSPEQIHPCMPVRPAIPAALFYYSGSKRSSVLPGSRKHEGNLKALLIPYPAARKEKGYRLPIPLPHGRIVQTEKDDPEVKRLGNEVLASLQ
jgi:hypothetical protein